MRKYRLMTPMLLGVGLVALAALVPEAQAADDKNREAASTMAAMEAASANLKRLEAMESFKRGRVFRRPATPSPASGGGLGWGLIVFEAAPRNAIGKTLSAL